MACIHLQLGVFECKYVLNILIINIIYDYYFRP